VTKRREAGVIPTDRQVRVRSRDFSLKYREDFGFGNLPRERTEQQIWDWHDHQDFFDSVIRNLPEYKSLIAVLEPRRQDHGIESFARFISTRSFHCIDDEELLNLANTLGRELDGQALPVAVTAFIDGIGIDEPRVVVSDAFTLRKPTADDLAKNVECIDEHGGNCIGIHIDPSEDSRLIKESDILAGSDWPCND
jgi:hypothetical protein